MTDAVKNLTAGMMKEEVPEIKIGSTVRVHVKIREGERERIQIFEGTVIAKNNSGIAETFTVRRVSYGVNIILQRRRKTVANNKENNMQNYIYNSFYFSNGFSFYFRSGARCRMAVEN